MFLWSWLTIFFATLGGVELFRRWSLRRQLLDVPNERSSHSVPTPRGGGLIIVIVTVAGLGLFGFLTGKATFWPYLAGALIVATISFVDDLRPLSPFIRLLAHSAAAAIAVYASGGIHSVEIPLAGTFSLGHFAMPFGFLSIIWLTNAYNFMDGIDGIAAVQAIVAGGGWAAAGALLGSAEVAFIGGSIASASAGFLVLNWQPARIFMGDVGSAFLGYLFAVIPLFAAARLPESSSAVYSTGLLFVWFFVFDTILTFSRRLIRGEKIWQAHREHIYQYLVRDGWSHASTTTFYGILALFLAITTIRALVTGFAADKWVLITGAAETLILILVLFTVRKRGAE